MLFGKVFVSNSVRFDGICTPPPPPFPYAPFLESCEKWQKNTVLIYFFNEHENKMEGNLSRGHFSVSRPWKDTIIGVVTLDFFPKLLRKIAWVGFALVFDHFHVCGYTAIDKLPKGKKKLEHGLAGNVVIFDQFLILHF